jgi:UDP-N-acetylmuramate--alanine ligase
MLEGINSIFIVGIKGAGMANLAVILNQMGKNIFGWDVDEAFPTDCLLTKNNISFTTDHSAPLNDDINLVVYSAAHSGKDNIFVKQALSKGIRIAHQATVLGELMKDFKTPVAVSGCHGKTTTSSLLAYALLKLEANMSYFIGVPSFNEYTGSLYKGHDYLVVEADEYAIDPPEDRTPKFMSLHPEYIINTNIDFDHPDVYKNIEDTRMQFHAFFNLLSQKERRLILNVDDEQTALVLPSLKEETYVTYGFRSDTDLRITSIAHKPDGIHLTLSYNGSDIGVFKLAIFGEKNALNAAGVILFLLLNGFQPDDIRLAVAGFTGSKRRLEHINTVRGIDIFDDYAHHPAEIKSSIQALKSRYPSRRIIVIFQPHTFSRTTALADDFVEALSAADHAFLMPVFSSAREQADDKAQNADVLISLAASKKYSTIEKLPEDLKGLFKNGDVICMMGAGDVYKLTDVIISNISI